MLHLRPGLRGGLSLQQRFETKYKKNSFILVFSIITWTPADSKWRLAEGRVIGMQSRCKRYTISCTIRCVCVGGGGWGGEAGKGKALGQDQSMLHGDKAKESPKTLQGEGKEWFAGGFSSQKPADSSGRSAPPEGDLGGRARRKTNASQPVNHLPRRSDAVLIWRFSIDTSDQNDLQKQLHRRHLQLKETFLKAAGFWQTC